MGEVSKANSRVANPTTSSTDIQHTPAEIDQEKHDDEKDLTAEPSYITGLRLFLIMVTIFMSTLLAALEIGIIATAIPGITDDFHQLNDVRWYGSATFLLVGASSPMWSKMYKYLRIKWVYLSSVVFLLGWQHCRRLCSEQTFCNHRSSNPRIGGCGDSGWICYSY